MTLDELQRLKDSGNFHHATDRVNGNLWDGLWIYAADTSAARGFSPVGNFPPDDPNAQAAYEIVRDTGVSVGTYGQG